MRKRIGLAVVTGLVVLLAGTAAIAGGPGDRSDALKRAIDGGRATNVILLIGDGMGSASPRRARRPPTRWA
jgi:alkaline phosphatase